MKNRAGFSYFIDVNPLITLLQIMLDFLIRLHYNVKVARRCRLVRSRAHDWKSCNCYKQFEGSNPSISATRAGFLTCPFFIPKMSETPLNKGFAGCLQVRLEHLEFVLVGLLLGHFLELVGLLLGYQNPPVYAASKEVSKIWLGYFFTKR